MSEISPEALRAALYDEAELALVDVREPGQIAEGHILFSVPIPYSRFELDLPRLVPNPHVRMVLCDAGDGVAGYAAERARALGYDRVFWLAGGVSLWERAGHTLYRGVNVPSKAFGELVEHASGTPHIGAAELARLQADHADMVIVDGRTRAEFANMNIPGAHWCPNGELAMRIDALAPDTDTTIVVNCAGRTRSIIGAQTLIDLGVANRVVALENGTQGWTLAGLTLERGTEAALPEPGRNLAERRQSARALADRHGVATLDRATMQGWLSNDSLTVYLLDVRTDDERASDPDDLRATMQAHGVVHAPGGQLVQATDQWVGVRRARLVVLDTEGVRAPVVASWLARMGHDASIIDGGLDVLADLRPRPRGAPVIVARLPVIGPADLEQRRQGTGVTILDLRSSARYRAGHVPGANWTVRPRIAAAAGPGPGPGPCILVADEPEAAALAAIDLAEGGQSDILMLDGNIDAWRAAGLALDATPDLPSENERIDFVAFTHGRHDGNAAASRQYLAWEIGLVDQLDEQERAVFRV